MTADLAGYGVNFDTWLSFVDSWWNILDSMDNWFLLKD